MSKSYRQYTINCQEVGLVLEVCKIMLNLPWNISIYFCLLTQTCPTNATKKPTIPITNAQ